MLAQSDDFRGPDAGPKAPNTEKAFDEKLREKSYQMFMINNHGQTPLDCVIE